MFHISDKEDRTWWNLGGWRNTQDGIENSETLDPKPGHIETGRWYDIRLEVLGNRVKCYLDGQLVHDVAYQSESRVPGLFASASRDETSADVIVKVVNADPHPLKTVLSFPGASNLTGRGTMAVLTSDSPADENSLAEPHKVSPATVPLTFDGTALERAFPGNSLNILRLKTIRQ